MLFRSFIPPDNFDLEGWWAEEMEAYGKGDLKIVFLASPTAAPDLRRLHRKKESVFEDLDDGGLRVTLFADSWHWLVPILASYGPEVVVEEPVDFRREMEALFSAAAAAYRSSKPSKATSASGKGQRTADTRLRSTRGRPE